MEKCIFRVMRRGFSAVCSGPCFVLRLSIPGLDRAAGDR